MTITATHTHHRLQMNSGLFRRLADWVAPPADRIYKLDINFVERRPIHLSPKLKETPVSQYHGLCTVSDFEASIKLFTLSDLEQTEKAFCNNKKNVGKSKPFHKALLKEFFSRILETSNVTHCISLFHDRQDERDLFKDVFDSLNPNRKAEIRNGIAKAPWRNIPLGQLWRWGKRKKEFEAFLFPQPPAPAPPTRPRPPIDPLVSRPTSTISPTNQSGKGANTNQAKAKTTKTIQWLPWVAGGAGISGVAALFIWLTLQNKTSLSANGLTSSNDNYLGLKAKG